MHVTIRLYASYREQAGTGRVEVSLTEPATVSDAIHGLLDGLPSMSRSFRPHLIAVNDEFANLEYPLHDGDQIALYPPVSGGVDVRVVDGEIDAREAAGRVRRPGNGAVITMEGTTRDNTNGRGVRFLEYEADARMAHRVMAGVLEETAARFGVTELAARHRVGRLEIGDVSLIVSVGAPHRLEAFLAAQYAVDRIKHIVPVWKKEHFEDGSVWVGVACDPETHARELAEAPYAGFLAARETGEALPSAHEQAHA